MRTVSVKLMADAADFNRTVRGASLSVKGLAGDLDKAGKAGHLDHVTDMATGLGLGLLGTAAIAVKFSAQFEKQMSAVQAATHASAGEVDQLRKAALQAGKDTQFSATEAAQGVEELAKAGVSTANILGGGLKGALDLAAAGELGVGEAAETAASALTQFKLRGQDVPHVADLLSAAAGKAQGSVHDMGAALNQAGLVASQTGLTLEETAGGLAAFASAGLTGSDAGTSFKQMLLMLQAPSVGTQKLMDSLGITLYDNQGQFIGLAKFAGQLQEQLKDLTPEMRNASMAQIFGADATRAASIVYEQGAAGIQSWIDKTNDAGYAAETAAIKTDNLAGDVERLQGSLETAAIESGGGLNQGLRVLTKSADALVGSIEKLPAGTTAAITVMAAIGGVLTLGLVGWVKSRAAVAAAVVELNAVGPAGARAATGLQAASKWAGRAAIAFVGLEVVGAVADKLGNSAVNVTKLTSALQDYATTGKLTQGLTDEFGTDLENFSNIAGSAEAASHGFWGSFNDAISSVPGVSSVVDTLNESLYGTSFNDATDKMKALDESFSAFIATQKDPGKAGELWNDLIHKSGLETDQLANLLPGAWKGLVDLQAAAHGGAGAQGDLAAKTQVTTEQLEAQKEEAKQLQKAFDDLFGNYMSADQAAIQYEQTLKSTNEELKKGTRTLSVHSEEGQKNRQSVLAMIDAIKDQRDANIANGMSVEDADKKYRSQIGTLGKTMEKLGFTRSEVEKLIGKYRDVPGKVGTTIETPGLPAAREGVKDYGKKLDALTRNVKTKIGTEGEPAARAKLEKLLVLQQALKKGISLSAAQSAFNKNAYSGGGWTGPGSKYDEAGVVHADEFVVQKESRERFERDNPGALDHINRYGTLPMYADGGHVTWPYPVNAAGTRIPSRAEATSAVTPAVPSGGRTSDWIVATVKARFPGIDVLSKDRPGARTLSGNVSYHARGRAVDFEPSRDLAGWWDANYRSRTKELISPYQQYNIHNGTRHAYTGAVWNQHNFAGGNAHDHIAMGDGGVIREHVIGVGESGTTYEFGERGIPETVTPGYLPSGTGGGAGGRAVTNNVSVTVNAPIGAHPREIGREVLQVIGAHLESGGELRVHGQKVL